MFLAWPQWLDAEVHPWSCRADGDPHLVEDPERCTTCGRWVGRRVKAAADCRKPGDIR